MHFHGFNWTDVSALVGEAVQTSFSQFYYLLISASGLCISYDSIYLSIMLKRFYITDFKAVKATPTFSFSSSYLDIGEIKKRPMEAVNTEVIQILF